MNAIRAAGDCDHAGGETATTRTAVSVNAFCRARMSPLLERRAHREVERAEVLAGLAVRVDPVVDADRPERRLPPDPAADPLLQIRQIELRPEPVHVTDIKEPGEPEAERQRDDVLRVAEHLGRAADSLTGVVFRRDRVELEAPDRVGPAEIEPLEKRQRFIGPAEAIVRLDATAQDVAEPDRVELGRKHSGLHVLRITAESGELRRHVALSALRRRDDVVATVAPHSSRHRRGHLDSLLVLELCRQRRDVAEVADPVARRPVAEGPPPVLEERVTQPERGSQRLVAILGVLPRVAVQVESPGEGAIEQPRIREADHPLLCPAATAQTHGDLPATPEEVTLREVDGADEAVHRREAAAEAEDARRALGDLDVDDDLRLVRPWLGGDLDFFEVAEVHELLAGPVLLLQRVEVPLVERDLAAENLVLAADVAADVDTLDEHLGPLGDVERDVDDVLAGHLLRLGDDVHRCAADGAVEVLDAPEALAQLRPREHVPGLHLQLAPDLLLGEERDPVELDLADLELRSLDYREGDRHARLLTVHGHIGGLDAGLDVAVVVVELNDSLDVLVESLALHLAAEDEVLSLSGRERVLELALREPLVALEEDPVDLDLTTLDDAEHHANVTVGKLLDVRRHLDLEIPLVLVEVPELLDGALDVYRVVDAAQLEIDLVLELRGLHGLVPGEVDVPDERPFVDDERHLHPALEVLDPHLHVVEEAQAEDRPDVLGEEGRVEGRADGGLDPAEHDGLLDPPRALDRDLLDDDRAQLSRAVGRIVPLLDERRLGGRREHELDPLVGQLLVDPPDHQADDLLDVVEPEGVEDDDVVDAVQELRSERALELLQHALLHLLVGRLVALLEEPGRHALPDQARAEVRRHDQDRVLEVDDVTERVGQPPVVQYLKEHVEHVGVCLLDLVEEHDGVQI